MHASVHAINVNEKSFLRKDQKKDNQKRLAKEELDSRDKHHKILFRHFNECLKFQHNSYKDPYDFEVYMYIENKYISVY